MSGQIEARRAEVYRMLGVTPEAVSLAPQITPQLRMIANTIRRDGQPQKTRKVVAVNVGGSSSTTLVEELEHHAPYGPGSDLHISWPSYLASSDHIDAMKVLRVYNAIPRGLRSIRAAQPILPVEAYCVAAGVHPTSVLAILTAEVIRLGAQASSMIAAINHPRVVQKSVDMALTDDGIDDRVLLSKATGFLPAPKGAQTNIHVQANASAAAPTQIAMVSAPPPEQTIRRLVDRFNDAKALPTAPPHSILEQSPRLAEEVVAIEDELDEDTP